MEHNQLILSAKDVNIQFNLRGKVLHAIRGIDLDLYQGEVLAIVGESGSGKSVFTKSFMGLLDANGSITSGTIDYYGMADGKPLRLSDLRTEKDWLRVRGREIAMVMQDPMTSLNPLKTIGAQIMEAVALHQGLKGAAAENARLAEEIESVNMALKTMDHVSERIRATFGNLLNSEASKILFDITDGKYEKVQLYD